MGGIITRIRGRRRVLDEAAEGPGRVSDGEAVRRIIAYVDANVEADIDMSKLPEMTGMRYDKFSRLFHTATGMTPHQYYLDLKMKTAVELLQSGLSVKETSYRLCFDSPFYFSRLFKKKTGESPQSFKINAV